MQERQVIRWRYGLDDEALTLEEVGNRLDVTRERVRQIQNKAERKLLMPQKFSVIRSLHAVLVSLFEDAGGLMNDKNLGSALGREVPVGKVDPAGVARLAFEVTRSAEWVREAAVWVLTDVPPELVLSVNRHAPTRVLEDASIPLSSEKLIARFKEARFYQEHRDQLSDAFVGACLRANP